MLVNNKQSLPSYKKWSSLPISYSHQAGLLNLIRTENPSTAKKGQGHYYDYYFLYLPLYLKTEDHQIWAAEIWNTMRSSIKSFLRSFLLSFNDDSPYIVAFFFCSPYIVAFLKCSHAVVVKSSKHKSCFLVIAGWIGQIAGNGHFLHLIGDV